MTQENGHAKRAGVLPYLALAAGLGVILVSHALAVLPVAVAH